MSTIQSDWYSPYTNFDKEPVQFFKPKSQYAKIRYQPTRGQTAAQELPSFQTQFTKKTAPMRLSFTQFNQKTDVYNSDRSLSIGKLNRNVMTSYIGQDWIPFAARNPQHHLPQQAKEPQRVQIKSSPRKCQSVIDHNEFLDLTKFTSMKLTPPIVQAESQPTKPTEPTTKIIQNQPYSQDLELRTQEQLKKLRALIQIKDKLNKHAKSQAVKGIGKVQTALMKDVQNQKTETFKRYHSLMKESITNPTVLLSPRSYARNILSRQVLSETEVAGLMKSCTLAARNQVADSVVLRAQERLLQVPYYEQDFGFKLIKMNDVNFAFWDKQESVISAKARLNQNEQI